MLSVGVDADDAGERAPDAGFVERLADSGLGDGLAEASIWDASARRKSDAAKKRTEGIPSK